MMKKYTLAVAILVVSMLFTTLASAQSNIPGSGWWSGQQVQNVGTENATIVMEAYDKDPSVDVITVEKTAAPGEAPTFLPSDLSVTSFQGSAVLVSDQPIKAIVNVTNRESGDNGIAGGYAAAQYQGIDGSMVADTLYFPLVKGDSYGKTTTFFVQNTSSEATTITALFTMRNGDTHTWTSGSIASNRMVIFSVLDTTTFNTSVANDGKVGGLKVTSSGGTLAGVVMEHNTTEDPATILQSTRGFTASDFDTKLYAPVIKNLRFGRFTGIQVQNVGTDAVDITVTYKTSACTDPANTGQTFTDTATGVPGGESKTFVNLTASGTNLPEGCTASATIVATGNIVAIVNESYGTGYIPSTGQSAVTSSAIADNSATQKVSVPLFKDDRFDKRTGLQIQNVGEAAATNIVATFSCSGAASFTAISNPQSADPGSAVLFIHPSNQTSMFTSANPFSAASVNCGVTVTSDQPIVAIANESVPGGMGFTTIQDNNNYEGFNLTE